MTNNAMILGLINAISILRDKLAKKDEKIYELNSIIDNLVDKDTELNEIVTDIPEGYREYRPADSKLKQLEIADIEVSWNKKAVKKGIDYGKKE